VYSICVNRNKLICTCNNTGICNNIKEIMKVQKSDWSFQDFDWKKIETFYKRVNSGLNTKCPYRDLEQNLKNYIVDWIKTEDINKMIIKSAIDLISPKNISWQNIAGRFMMKNLYKRWSRTTWIPSSNPYKKEYLLQLIKDYTKEWLYNKRILEEYTEEEILELWEYINPDYDMDYVSGTVLMYDKRYLINNNWKIRELPQHLYLVNALFLGLPEKDNRIDFVKKLYDLTATWKISLPTPTLLNARTPNSQLSSCFILTPADDLRSIYHNIEEMAQISKNWGWIGVYLWNIRAKGSIIKGVYWLSWGVNPWIKVINDTAVAVNQMGKRAWAISVTLDVFHKDIYHFLDLQTETWDIRSKSFDVFPSVSFPDLFFKRVEEDKDWSLFCPKEVEDIYWFRLQDKFGEEFISSYEELEKSDKLKIKDTVKARDLFKVYLKAVVETWMPYAFYRDTVNRLNPNKHSWNVYCSNLCCEIAQNQSENTFIAEEEKDWIISTKFQSWDTVVCNLTSINLAKVNTDEHFKEVIPVALRCLDNTIELNAYPNKETEISSKKYRPVWLWTLWLAQYLAEKKVMYWTEESVKVVWELYKSLSYHTLKSSVDLAEERGSYPACEWSEYSKGIAFWKDIVSLYGDKELWRRMRLYWTRFGYHLAPAPNTSTALVVWTTAWVVPVYKKYFVETNQIAPTVNVAPNLSEDNFWFYPEYVNMELWGVIDVVAEIQKWIDQSISFEWLINPQKTSPKDLYNYYLKAWKDWLKTVYYVRSQSLSVDNCESCSW
jgi:ribonucleoside-diphosphate reductase alpha chain